MKANMWKTRRLGGALLVACCAVGVLPAVSALGQTTLAEFKFDEGTGSKTKSTVNDLTGNLGPIANPDAIPISTTDTPSGLANDRAVQLTNGAFLVADDSASPILAKASTPLTLEGWVKRDSASTATYEGIIGYGGAYKLGLQAS